MIVENEQKGLHRAGYAEQTLKQLSKYLTKEFGRGFSYTNLEYFRKFYTTYSTRIPQSVIEESKKKQIPQSVIEKSRKKQIPQSVIEESKIKFVLSWTHYVQLLKIDDVDERSFYEIEAAKNNWSVRELQRQYDSSLYERLLLSRNKKKVKELAKKGQIIQAATDVLKDHVVLEFLGLDEKSVYTETDLEAAIINRVEQFMMEMGRGFLFDSRQKRIALGGDNHYIDLVFFNRILKCFVLIDLKIGKLAHKDIGQMQMYVNYFDRKIKMKEENPTMGIILCKYSNKAVVEFTLPESNKTIFAKEYKLYLPSKADLKKQLT